MLKLATHSYSGLAAEYYDALRHPTCANLREASCRLLKKWLCLMAPVMQQTCEVGVGKSVLCDELVGQNVIGELTLLDESIEMLRHSFPYVGSTVQLVVADAKNLPFARAGLGSVVASLGDAYNEPPFWSEVARVLRPGGVALYTTPSYEWAECFRTAGDRYEAVFDTSDGATVRVPSVIYPIEVQTALISGAGLRVSDVSSLPVGGLTGPISQKLKCGDRRADMDVVTAYRVIRT